MHRAHQWRTPIAGTLGIIGLAVAVSQLLLRNLFRFLAFDETFYLIFAQIQDTCILPPFILLLAMAAFLAALWAWLGRVQKRACRISILLLIILLSLGLVLLTILCSSVNGIVFWDVLRSLLPLLEGGFL